MMPASVDRHAPRRGENAAEVLRALGIDSPRNGEAIRYDAAAICGSLARLYPSWCTARRGVRGRLMPSDAPDTKALSRRSLLGFLLGSPLLIAAQASALERLLASAAPDEALGERIEALIPNAEEAIDVFDYHAVARNRLSEAHYTYLSMGVQHEVTLRANREAFAHFQLRPRRLVDVRELKTQTEILGIELSCPIVLAPVGSQRAYHAEGELAVARAARAQDYLQIVSMGSSASLEEVAEARGAPVWSQLYLQRSWPVTRHFLRQAEAAECPVIVLTVDIVGLPSGRDRIDRFRRADNAACQPCHASMGVRLLLGAERLANAVGLDPRAVLSESMMLDWGVVDRIRDATSAKLVIKGILVPEDASLCVEHGIDGIIVSNHGGRAEDHGLATIDALPDVVEAVAGRIPVLVDSGFRRGTDIFKALALGASAVCVGRPYLWGLAAFGQPGVGGVLAILRREFETIMRQMGTPDLASIEPGDTRALIRKSPCSEHVGPDR
jgi:isopentenyl diphosphate isomerase/L-lactate dehydrogenase-like FMN-dependent dehydrogenase